MRTDTPNYLNVPISPDLKERLDKYASANGIIKRRIVEFALEAYLAKVTAK